MKAMIKQIRSHSATEILEDALCLGALCVLILGWFTLS
tara:strand:+ start:591 stop:704 length:114 start_codon:yes stop_codon:yes gene_type:complete